MSFIMPGFLNVVISMITKDELRLNFWAIAGIIGLLLSTACFSLALIIVFRNGQPAEGASRQILLSSLRQIIFAFVNIILGLNIGLFSMIFALYALSNAVRSRREKSGILAERQLKTAKSLNIIAVIFVGVQWLAIALFAASVHEA
jgi:hypothetical protein